ncbi:MAG: translational GTPase TypA, partial [Bdellovibrionales bacterium]|nr:translational GTPase TypA [Bdellovibrionales bacterium]NQZ18376.1 translational GTPase TypA [Bdellovibrionales bacterium]
RGEIESRHTGAIISDRKGIATPYAIFGLEDRGQMFIPPSTDVYMGMIIGEANKATDLNVNICREKKLTNVRASGSDEGIKLTPPRKLTLESALEWVKDDELIEVTPENIRLRCRELDPNKRKVKKDKDK